MLPRSLSWSNGVAAAGKPTQGPVQVILLKSITWSKGRPAVAEVEGLWGVEREAAQRGQATRENTRSSPLHPKPSFPRRAELLWFLPQARPLVPYSRVQRDITLEPRKTLLIIFTANILSHLLFTLHKSVGEGNGTPLQYSCLENTMDGEAWWAAVHGVTKSQTRLSDFTFPFHFHALEKEMATHSSVPAWRIPGMGEPGGLLSMGSHRVGHDWSDLAAAAAQFRATLLP